METPDFFREECRQERLRGTHARYLEAALAGVLQARPSCKTLYKFYGAGASACDVSRAIQKAVDTDEEAGTASGVVSVDAFSAEPALAPVVSRIICLDRKVDLDHLGHGCPYMVIITNHCLVSPPYRWI